MRLYLYQRDLSPAPQNWHELNRHPHRDSFIAAARLEFETLRIKETFIEMYEMLAKKIPIPTKWVFSYKVDDGYLLKYKARLVIRLILKFHLNKTHRQR